MISGWALILLGEKEPFALVNANYLPYPGLSLDLRRNEGTQKFVVVEALVLLDQTEVIGSIRKCDPNPVVLVAVRDKAWRELD